MAASAVLSPRPVLPPIGASRTTLSSNDVSDANENAHSATCSAISAISPASDFASNPFEYSRTIADMLDELQKETDYQRKASLCMAHIDAGLCEMIKSAWDTLAFHNPRQWTKLDAKQDAAVNSWKNLSLMVIVATADGEGDALSKVLDKGTVNFAIDALCTDLFHPSSYSKHQPTIACILMTIVYNVVRRWNIDLEKARAVKGRCGALVKYIANGNPALKTLAIMLFACTLGEDEQKNVQGQVDSHIRHMVRVLDDCVKSRRTDHSSEEYGYSAYEIMKGLRRLAASDVNKDKLVAYGAMAPYSRVIRDNSFSADEKKEACKALWSFAFSSSNRSKISTHKDSMAGLRHISENCQGSLKAAADGTLWVLARETQHIKEISTVSPTATTMTQKGCDVALSFHRSVQEQAERVKDRLVEAGYTTRLVADHSLPYSPDKVAAIIDGATVVIALYTESYKLSSACRLEAQYAKNREKSLIALKMERTYSPDGWLSELLQNRLSLDFSNADSQHEEFQSLSAAIRAILQGATTYGSLNNAVEQTATVSPAFAGLDAASDSIASDSLHASPSQSRLRQKADEYAALKTNKWEEDQVRDWFDDGKLNKYLDRFTKYTGAHLVALRRIMDTAPEFFYSSLKHQYNLDMQDILTFSNMIQSLE